jgi:hypothetical protein
LDKLIATGDFDLLKNAIDAYAQLFNRFYDDVDRRTVVEQKVRSFLSKAPITLRIEMLVKLANFALERGDKSKGIELVNEAQAIFDGLRWTADQQVVIGARLAGLRGRAEDTARARTDADVARALFHAEREKIITTDRAAALRSIAEAYHWIGDAHASLEVYRTSLEEGATNPNSRPRALDLAATCRSMALHGVEPDAELWGRLRQVGEGLGQPW